VPPVIRSIFESLVLVFLTFEKVRNRNHYRRIRNAFSVLLSNMLSVHRDGLSYVQQMLAYEHGLFFCKVSGDSGFPTRPVIPDCQIVCLYTGYLKHRLNFIAMKSSRIIKPEYLCFAYSLLKGAKQSWSLPSEQKVYQSLCNFRELWGAKAHPISPFLSYSFAKIIRNTLDDIELSDFNDFSPNDHATLSHTARKGGALANVNRLQTILNLEKPKKVSHKKTKVSDHVLEHRRLAETGDSWQSDSPFRTVPTFEIVKLSPYRERIICVERHESFSESYISSFREIDDFRGANRPHEGVSINVKLMILPNLTSEVEVWRSTEYERFRGLYLRESVYDIKVTAILEADKVRVIGINSESHSALRPVKSALIHLWKRQPQSTMMIVGDLTPRVQEYYDGLNRTMERYKPWDEFIIPKISIISGDYTSATDTVSRKFFDIFCLIYSRMQLPGADLVKKAPNFGTAHFSPWNKSHGPRAMSKIYGGEPEAYKIQPQTFSNGQPMGHLLSFFALCCTNKAVAKTTVDLWVVKCKSVCRESLLGNGFKKRLHRFIEKTGKYIYSNCLINGDDILLMFPEPNQFLADFFPCFTEMVSDAGFKLSVGKNYVNRNIAMINSQLMLNTDGVFTRVGYLNQRIIKGLPNFEKNLLSPLALATSINEMMEFLPNRCVSLIPMIMNRPSTYFKGCYYLGSEFKPNWFLPVHLGGLGISMKFSRGPLEVTLAQRKVAALFMQTDLGLFARTGKRIRCEKLKKMFGTPVDVPKSWMVDDFYVNDHPLCAEHCRLDSPYEESTHDPWLAYLAYVERYSSMTSEETPLVSITNQVREQLKSSWSVNPVQYQTILDWFEIRTLSPKRLPCPRLGPLLF